MCVSQYIKIREMQSFWVLYVEKKGLRLIPWIPQNGDLEAGESLLSAGVRSLTN